MGGLQLVLKSHWPMNGGLGESGIKDKYSWGSVSGQCLTLDTHKLGRLTSPLPPAATHTHTHTHTHIGHALSYTYWGTVLPHTFNQIVTHVHIHRERERERERVGQALSYTCRQTGALSLSNTARIAVSHTYTHARSGTSSLIHTSRQDLSFSHSHIQMAKQTHGHSLTLTHTYAHSQLVSHVHTPTHIRSLTDWTPCHVL